MLRRRLVLLGALAPLASHAQQPDPLREFFRMIELDSRSAVLEALLRGMDPNVLAPNGQRPLHWALVHESGQALDGLLSDPRTDVEAENASGERPLMLAALRGQEQLVVQLVSKGAEVNKSGWTPLHYAATGGHLRVAAFLIGARADVNAESPNGTTPLMMAAIATTSQT